MLKRLLFHVFFVTVIGFMAGIISMPLPRIFAVQLTVAAYVILVIINFRDCGMPTK